MHAITGIRIGRLKRMRKYLLSIVLCILIILLSAPCGSSYLRLPKTSNLIKEWEIDLTQDDENALKYLQPIEIAENPERKEVYINCIGKILCINQENGKILKKYSPEENMLFFDFILDNSFLYISSTPKDEESDLKPYVKKINTEKNETVWKTDLPFDLWGCYLTLYLSDDKLLVTDKYRFCILETEGGKILENFEYLPHVMEYLFNSSYLIKDSSLYIFVENWQDILKIQLPSMVLSSQKVHVEQKLSTANYELAFIGVIGSDCFLFSLRNQLFLVDENGKIVSTLKMEDQNIRFPMYRVSNGTSNYMNPAIYGDYVFGQGDKSICLMNFVNGESYQKNSENFLNISLPCFYSDKLFLLNKLSNRNSEIMVLNIPDLEIVSSIREDVFNWSEIKIRESLFPLSSPFLIMEGEKSVNLIVALRSKICLYKVSG